MGMGDKGKALERVYAGHDWVIRNGNGDGTAQRRRINHGGISNGKG